MNELNKAYALLAEVYGSHVKAAKELGIAPSHYRGLRNGYHAITDRMRFYILAKALEAGNKKGLLEKPL